MDVFFSCFPSPLFLTLSDLGETDFFQGLFLRPFLSSIESPLFQKSSGKGDDPEREEDLFFRHPPPRREEEKDTMDSPYFPGEKGEKALQHYLLH